MSMKATVVLARLEPGRIPDAARAVEEEVAPALCARAGARRGYWMVDRHSGQVLIVTVWADETARRAAAAAEGARRAVVGERVGLRVLGTQSFDVAGSVDEHLGSAPRVRWVRATWVAHIGADQRGVLPQLYHEAVPDQARTRGFCASYWLVDPLSGAGLGLSMWEGPDELRGSLTSSRRRRRRFEAVLGCTVDGVHEYEALAVAVAPDPRPPSHSPAPVGFSGTSVLARALASSTHIERPPGALLAVEGEQTDQVVIVARGSAVVVEGGDLRRLEPGEHFGGRRIEQRAVRPHTVMATACSRLGVLSRSELRDFGHAEPELLAALVHDDADP